MSYDIYGHWSVHPVDPAEVAGMFSPVRCVCGRIYDMGKVEVTARYADCSMWKAPCCGRTADDRYGTGWSSVKHYDVIDKREVMGW